MKKIIVGLVALLLFIPIYVNATVKGIDINSLSTADAETNDDGTFTKTVPIYVTTDSSNSEVTVAKVQFRPNKTKNSEVTKITCTGAQPFDVTSSTKDDFTVCEFKVPSGSDGAKGSKVMVGYLTVTIPESASNCDIEAQLVGGDGKTNPKTGANINFILVGCGAAAVGAIYFTTKSKKKLYNI